MAGPTPGSAESTLTNRLLVRATRRIEDLTATTTTADPVAAPLKAVDQRQLAAQLPGLEAVVAEVVTRRQPLPARPPAVAA